MCSSSRTCPAVKRPSPEKTSADGGSLHSASEATVPVESTGLHDIVELIVRPLERERANTETLREPEDCERALRDAVRLAEQEETRPIERSGRHGEGLGGRREIGQPVVSHRALECRTPARHSGQVRMVQGLVWVSA